MPSSIEGLGELVKWFIPPPGHDENVEYLWRWRLGVFGCLSFFGIALLYCMMILEWGLPMIRPASAQVMQRQISVARADLQASVSGVQQQVKEVAATQREQVKAQTADRLERIDQQLFWYRVQNCKARGQAKLYTAQKLDDLRRIYRELTGGSEWLMPSCVDVGG